MILTWIKDKVKQRRHDRLVQEYREFGAKVGDAISYSDLGTVYASHRGKRYSLEEQLEKLDVLEEQYSLLGYRIIPLDRWVDYGGYGASIDDIWLIERAPGERPAFTKDETL